MRDGIAYGGEGGLTLKVYHEGTAIPLSDRVPVLEHFGFRVIDERTYTINPRDGVTRYLHDMVLATADGSFFEVAANGAAGIMSCRSETPAAHSAMKRHVQSAR